MKPITSLKIIILFSIIVIISDRIVSAQPIYVSLPADTTGEPATSISIPIRVSDLTGRGIISYQTVITFNENVLDATGASSANTLSSTFGPPTVNIAIEGQISIGSFGTSSLSGKGSTLVNLTFDVVGQLGDTTSLIFNNFFFNSGEPVAITTIGNFTISNPSHVNHLNGSPGIFKLYQNYPNPFNPETEIRYQISEPVLVELIIYNSVGQKICSLVNEKKQTGYFSIRWNGKDETESFVASGIYFCIFKAGEFRDIKKMIVLR